MSVHITVTGIEACGCGGSAEFSMNLIFPDKQAGGTTAVLQDADAYVKRHAEDFRIYHMTCRDREVQSEQSRPADPIEPGVPLS